MSVDYKRVVVSRIGGPEVLEVSTEPLPDPAPGEARVRVLAAGVSFGDVLARVGALPDAPKPPFTPGFDVTGIVEELGAGVESPAVGRPVVALLDGGGGYTELSCLPADRLVPLPEGVDPVGSAAAAVNYFAAHQMLHRVARVEAGQRILVHGAAGGLGTALLQLARRAGLEAYGTASKVKHALVGELGAVAIDPREEDFVARIRNLTGDGVDAVFDAVGGMSFPRSYRALRPRGHLVAYGVARAVRDGRRSRPVAVASFLFVKLAGLLPFGRAATFYTAGGLDESQPGSYREDLAAVMDLLARGEIEPVIAERLPLVDAARAHELLGRSAVSGKIVLICAAAEVIN